MGLALRILPGDRLLSAWSQLHCAVPRLDKLSSQLDSHDSKLGRVVGQLAALLAEASIFLRRSCIEEALDSVAKLDTAASLHDKRRISVWVEDSILSSENSPS